MPSGGGSRKISIELRELLEVELAPYSSEGNCHMRGPAAPLPAEPALAMQLVLHELATNAAKYGALSTAEGRLRVRWDIEPGADGKNMLWVRWAERGGPKATTPEKPGFGTQLIATTVQHDLGGEYEATYASHGFRCEITIPWKASASSASGS